MAVKTITIDIEAYDRLAALKREGQSFSQVIKELVPDKPSRARDLLSALDQTQVSESTIQAIESAVAERRRSPVRVPRL
jgi:predicted CopG family antitoxin